MSGTDLQRLPELSSLVLELKFIPTIERLQEADHSVVHRGVNLRTVTGPYVSCILRLPEIRALMFYEVRYRCFWDQYVEVDNLDRMARLFSFQKHPQWQLACHDKEGKKKMTIAAAIMYSMDFETQFDKMAHVKKAREKRGREREQVRKSWNAHFASKQTFSLQAVEEMAMSDHVQSEVQVGRLYSLPAGSASVRSLPSSLQPVHLQPSPAGRLSASANQAEALTLVVDFEVAPGISQEVVPVPAAVAEAGEAPEGQGDHFFVEGVRFFRLTCARPRRHKLVTSAAASGCRPAFVSR